MTAQFLHKKKDSSLWYYRRRYPVEVAKTLRKGTHMMRSLETANKREAERLSRAVSVQFDTLCEEARREHMFQKEVRQEIVQGLKLNGLLVQSVQQVQMSKEVRRASWLGFLS